MVKVEETLEEDGWWLDGRCMGKVEMHVEMELEEMH